ncbi:hypothetical protein TYRP_020334 [Tyrophagus putrescentiae]|nr:hypothetical protein TYRP_020334 [Tyrophagus putrescentiae]
MIEPCRKEDDTTTQTVPETVIDSKQQQQQQDEEYFERRIEFEAPEVLKLFLKFEEDEEPPELKILQKWDSDESGVVWDASLLLAKYLERLAASKDDGSKKSLFSDAKAVELGSGTGFLGLWLAAMGARVLLTDLPSNLELMGRNLKLNSSSSTDGLINEDLVSIAAFDWLDDRHIDYFIVSDCLYYKEGIEAIYSLLDWVLGDLQTSAQFLIAYEDREDKAEMITQFLIVISHNPALKCTEIPATELHPDYHSPDLHLLLIVARKEK